jgi:hypothetical protein
MKLAQLASPCLALLQGMTAILPSTALALLALCAVVHASDLSQFITAHEGVRLCVYMDTSNIRTICVGLNVQQPSAKALIQAEGGNYTAIRYGPVCPYTKCYSLRCPSQDTACAAASSTGQGCITTPRGCDNILVQQLASFEQEVQRSVATAQFDMLGSPAPANEHARCCNKKRANNSARVLTPLVMHAGALIRLQNAGANAHQ